MAKADAGRERAGKYDMKPLFEERMRNLLPDEKDFTTFSKVIHTRPRRFIRCNTLKITPEKLIARLRERWTVEQPYPRYPEIMVVTSSLAPGELGNAIEHLLGYYYVQELSSMLSPLALKPQPGEFVLDMCASPGSKTTQMAAMMENTGTLIANDVKLDRVKILTGNLERCGVANTIVTRMDGVVLAERLAKHDFMFDAILLDAPCSGEGTLRSSPKTFQMWNYKVVKKLSREQTKLFAYALRVLKKGGRIVYSTCTHAPEENEGVVNAILEQFPVKLETLDLPVTCRAGITSWREDSYNPLVSNCCRVYPHDNDSEGFFVSMFTLKEEVKQ